MLRLCVLYNACLVAAEDQEWVRRTNRKRTVRVQTLTDPYFRFLRKTDE